jgi:hypothetical protein
MTDKQMCRFAYAQGYVHVYRLGHYRWMLRVSTRERTGRDQRIHPIIVYFWSKLNYLGSWRCRWFFIFLVENFFISITTMNDAGRLRMFHYVRPSHKSKKEPKEQPKQMNTCYKVWSNDVTVRKQSEFDSNCCLPGLRFDAVNWLS